MGLWSEWKENAIERKKMKTEGGKHKKSTARGRRGSGKIEPPTRLASAPLQLINRHHRQSTRQRKKKKVPGGFFHSCFRIFARLFSAPFLLLRTHNTRRAYKGCPFSARRSRHTRARHTHAHTRTHARVIGQRLLSPPRGEATRKTKRARGGARVTSRN